MLGYLGYAVAAVVARTWMATSTQSWRRLPRPAGPPSAHAAGADPDRLLLVGAGIAVGYGVMRHDLALPGHLARQLSARTGRGASVEVIASSDMDCVKARTVLAGVDLERYDALVLILGGLEAFRLMPLRLWRRQFAAVLDQLEVDASSTLRVFAVETMTASAIVRLPAPVRGILRRHAMRVNAIMRELCESHAGVTFVPFDGGGDSNVQAVIARASYAGWSRAMVPVIDDALREVSALDRDRSWDEPARLDAVARLGGAPGPAAAQFVATARDLFGVATASVNLIDRHVQRTVATSGEPVVDHPRADTFCDLTIRRGGAFIVEDASTDPRVAHLTLAMTGSVQFYAGYSIESPDGHRVGALCLMDPAPRRFGAKDEALLRDLALRVQSALWQAVDA